MTEPAPAAPRRGFRLLTALGIPLLLLGGGELALRAAGYEAQQQVLRFNNPEDGQARSGEVGPFVTDADLFWKLRPGYRTPWLQISPQGFRGPAFDPADAKGHRRILCLGDSTTFGMLVNVEAAWPGALERRLHYYATPPRPQVINLGVPGYTAYQGRVLLERVLAWEPDDVVIAFGAFNDWVPAVGRPDAEIGRGWRQLRLAQLIGALTAGEPPAARTLGDGREAISTAHYTGPRRVPPAEFEANLVAMAESARAAGARTFFLIQPLPADTVARNPVSADYRARIRAAAEATGSALVDGYDVFAASPLKDHQLFGDFCHPHNGGHDLLASVLAEELRQTDDPRPPEKRR